MWDLGCRVSLRRKESSTCLLVGSFGGEGRGWDLGGVDWRIEWRIGDGRGGERVEIRSVYVIEYIVHSI